MSSDMLGGLRGVRVVAYSIFCGGEEGKGLGLGQKAERAAAREKERIQSDIWLWVK
jgi:hypothetical protein